MNKIIEFLSQVLNLLANFITASLKPQTTKPQTTKPQTTKPQTTKPQTGNLPYNNSTHKEWCKVNSSLPETASKKIIKEKSGVEVYAGPYEILRGEPIVPQVWHTDMGLSYVCPVCGSKPQMDRWRYFWRVQCPNGHYHQDWSCYLLKQKDAWQEYAICKPWSTMSTGKK